MHKIGLIGRTVRYLRPRQLIYQFVNRLRRRPTLRLPKHVPVGYFGQVPQADKPIAYCAGTFTFLNQSVQFRDVIDWNYRANGKLWLYNLHYFDYLNQASQEGLAKRALTEQEGLCLIRKFMAQTDALADGLEPYPTSLRIVNWVQFLSRHRIQDGSINAHLFAQVALLTRRLEYHLGGNHLLENGFALLTGALFFRHESWFRRAAKLVRVELMAQVLTDGAHSERSPVYHQILLDRLLDVLIMLRADSWHSDLEFVRFLSDKAAAMLHWLTSITFSNGDVPMVNDAAFRIAPTTAQLLAKATGVFPTACAPVAQNGQKESGYRLFRRSGYELFADVGAVGLDHQPGHAHADTVSFVLYVHGQPVIVDSGTSTYQTGPRRAWERSTAAHNTVDVNGLNSSEVWAGFRVGRRANVTVLADDDSVLSAQHDGYAPLGITHQRTWHLKPTEIHISDQLIEHKPGRYKSLSAVARLHFHPDVAVSLTADGARAGLVVLTFQSDKPLSIVVKLYDMAVGFNQLQTAYCLEVTFLDRLSTIVTLAE